MARRVGRDPTHVVPWLGSLLRLSASSLATMLATGILLDVAAKGAFHGAWWFRGSALLLLVAGALHGGARRTTRLVFARQADSNAIVVLANSNRAIAYQFRLNCEQFANPFGVGLCVMSGSVGSPQGFYEFSSTVNLRWYDRRRMRHDHALSVRADAGWALGPERPNGREPLLEHSTEPLRARVLDRANLARKAELTEKRDHRSL